MLAVSGWRAGRSFAVKSAEAWFAELRQTVVADTSSRIEPRPFPVRWLIPAIGVIAATLVVGLIRYPRLPEYLAIGVAHTININPIQMLVTYSCAITRANALSGDRCTSRAPVVIMVANRIGVGWSFNLGNPIAWLIIAAVIATAIALEVIRIVAGM